MFFQSVSFKGLSSEGKESQVWKKAKAEVTVAFYVSADGGKVGKPIVIWKSKKPRCFRLASAPNKLAQVSHFVDYSYEIKPRG